MNNKYIINLNTKPKIIKNEELNYIKFNLLFPIETKKYNFIYVSYLKNIITSLSKNIPNRENFNNEKIRKYILDAGIYSKIYEDTTFLVYYFTIPKENLINEYNMQESFDFCIDALLNPIVYKGTFDNDTFNYEKEYLINRAYSLNQSINFINREDFYNIIDPDEVLGLNYSNYLMYLNNITSADLYEFYKESVLNNKPLIYVLGNISDDKVNRLFNNSNFPVKEENISVNMYNFNPLKISNYRYIEKDNNSNISQLFIEYQITDYNKLDVTYFNAVADILSVGNNQLLFDNLRVNNNLVYSVNVSSFITYGVIVVKLNVSKKNVEYSLKLIDDALNELLVKEKLTVFLDRLIKGVHVDILKEEDERTSALSYAINNDLKLDNLKKYYNDIKNIDIDNLIGFVKRMKRTNTVFYRGDSE